MKKLTLIFFILTFGVLMLLSFSALSPNVVKGIKQQECITKSERIIEIIKESSNKFVLTDSKGDHYYTTRSLNLDSLNTTILNKTVTLHLPKLWLGTSEHIAQLEVNNELIFTEFN